MLECLTTGQANNGGNSNSSGATSFERGVSGHSDRGFDLNLPTSPTDFWAAGLGDGKLIEFIRALSVIQECSHCSQNGNNSSTCPNRGIKLFGVHLTDYDATAIAAAAAAPFPRPSSLRHRLRGLSSAAAAEDFVPAGSSSISPERNNACTSKEFTPEEEEIIIRSHELLGNKGRMHNRNSSGTTSFEGGVSGHSDRGFDLNLPSSPTDFWAAGLGDGKLIEFNRAPSVIQECSQCSQNGNNSSTWPNRGIKLFGVHLTVYDSAAAAAFSAVASIVASVNFAAAFIAAAAFTAYGFAAFFAALAAFAAFARAAVAAAKDFVPVGSSSSSRERNNACTSKEFTPEEEEIIIRSHELHGNNRSTMATMLPERTGEEITNHWDRILKMRLAEKGFEDDLPESRLQTGKNLRDHESEGKHKNKLELPWPLFAETSDSNRVTDSKSCGVGSSRSGISKSWGFSGPSYVN